MRKLFTAFCLFAASGCTQTPAPVESRPNPVVATTKPAQALTAERKAYFLSQSEALVLGRLRWPETAQFGPKVLDTDGVDVTVVGTVTVRNNAGADSRLQYTVRWTKYPNDIWMPQLSIN